MAKLMNGAQKRIRDIFSVVARRKPDVLDTDRLLEGVDRQIETPAGGIESKSIKCPAAQRLLSLDRKGLPNKCIGIGMLPIDDTIDQGL